MTGHDLVMMAAGMGLLWGVSLLIVGVLAWVEEREHRRAVQAAKGRHPARDIGLSCYLCERSIIDGPTHFRLYHDPRRVRGPEDWDV